MVYSNYKIFLSRTSLIFLVQLLFLFPIWANPGLKEAKREFNKSTNSTYFRSNHHPGYPIKKNLPFYKRVYALPNAVEAQLETWDSLEYEGVELSPEQITDFEKALKKLPLPIQNLMEESMLGFYFISDNFKGTGFAEATYTEDLKMFNFFVLNINVFNKTLDEWLTSKEMTNYKLDGRQSVKISTGTALSGLLGILLHESMHLVDYQKVISPKVDKYQGFWSKLTGKAPQLGSWYQLYRDPPDLSYSKDITFYKLGGGPKMSNRDLVKVYDELFSHPFPSLYAAKQPVEDYAELGLFAYIEKVAKGNVKLEVVENEEVVKTYQPLKHQKIEKRLSDVLPWIGIKE